MRSSNRLKVSCLLDVANEKGLLNVVLLRSAEQLEANSVILLEGVSGYCFITPWLVLFLSLIHI